jgi:hypothetical protein
MAQQITTIGGGSLPNNQSGSLGFQAGGPAGDAWVSEVHGKFYSANRAGRVWIVSALIAGVTIPVNTATAAVFGIYNPAGSGINLELISFDLGTITTGALTQGEILATISKQLPSSVTPAAAVMNPMNSGSPGGVAFTTATFAASTTHIPIACILAAAVAAGALHYDFDGKLILPPGWAMQITGSPAQVNVTMPCLTWAEHSI